MLARHWNRIRRSLRREEGQAAFEFLLIMPLFFLLILMMIDFGIAMYSHITIANAVREGARYGAVNCGAHCSEAKIQGRVRERSSGLLECAEIEVSWPDGSNRGDSVVVTVNHDHDFIFFPLPEPWEISTTAVMRLEQQDDLSGTGACT